MAIPTDCGCENYSVDDSLDISGEVTPVGCECLIGLVRGLSGDTETTPDFSDTRILKVIRAAAFYVTVDLAACTTITKPTVDPCGDFCENPLDFPSFSMLVGLRAACLMDIGQLRAKSAMEGLKAVLGPASMQMSQGSSSFDMLFKWGSCKSYADMREELCWKNPMIGATYSKQIVGSFISWDYRYGMGGGCGSC